MKNRWSLKKQNQGASLLAVLLALIFVGILGVVITNITISNIQMRSVEQSEKKNFYSAEEVMNELSVGLNEVAAQSMQNAYTTVLVNYRDILLNSSDVQQEFAKRYLSELQTYFWDDGEGRSDIKEKTDGGEVVYAIGSYKTDAVRGCIKTDVNKPCFVTENADASFEIDYKNGVFILKNIKIEYTDAQDYRTDITTDMVFHTPVLNFENRGVIQNFMRYALIADHQVKINAPNVKVDGSLYAGADGILCTGNSSGTLTGNDIVTRGDVVAENGCTLNIGTDSSRLWAENIETTGKGMPSYITLNGNCFISDDLVLNGAGSVVTLHGNYYGYNFQDNYKDTHAVTDSGYSSAIMINARDCKIDMQNLNYLFLAGRTYLSRGSEGNNQNQDIAMGESVSVRTNQLAYYVSDKFLDTADSSRAVFTEEGKQAYAVKCGVPDFMNYLDPAKQVVPYYYRNNGAITVRYYLNFASEQSANDFYGAYYAANQQKMNAGADTYATADALVLDENMLYTLKGNLLYKDAAGSEFQTKQIVIQPSDWQKAADGGSDGVYWELAENLAVTYKSLQLYLEESHAGITPENVRFMDGTHINKKMTPLFDHIIDRTALAAEHAAPPDMSMVTPVYEEKISEDSRRVVVVVNNAGADTYRIPTNYTEGIIIATGNVMVTGKFRGMILSGDTVSFAANASVTADELLVSQLFEKKTEPGFQKYFQNYETFSESAIGTVKMEDYLTYDNWKKNED